MQKWRIGDVTITKIVELESCGGAAWILPDAVPEACRDISWLKPDFMDEMGELKFSVHALVIETRNQLIVVDTCVGNEKERMPYKDWHHLQTTFLADFTAAGFDPAAVDCVLCTHLHVDHVGWNTMLVDGKWVPTFPNARYLIAKDEYDYFKRTDIAEFNQRVFNDSVAPIFDAGLMDLVETLTQDSWTLSRPITAFATKLHWCQQWDTPQGMSAFRSRRNQSKASSPVTLFITPTKWRDWIGAAQQTSTPMQQMTHADAFLRTAQKRLP